MDYRWNGYIRPNSSILRYLNQVNHIKHLNALLCQATFGVRCPLRGPKRVKFVGG